MSQEEKPLQEPQPQRRPRRHSRKKGISVVWYLLILFIAAFLLLLLSYFMQQRANQQDLVDIKNSVSALQTLDNLIADRDQLQEENASLKNQCTQLQDALDAARQEAKAAGEQAGQSQEQIIALHRLNVIRTLYNSGKYQRARDIIAQYDQQLEEQLAAVSKDVLSEAERDEYDPLEVYHNFKRWLNVD